MSLHTGIERTRDAYLSIGEFVRVRIICLGDAVVFANTDTLVDRVYTIKDLCATQMSGSLTNNVWIDCSPYRRFFVEFEVVPEFTHNNTIDFEAMVYSSSYTSKYKKEAIDKNTTKIIRFEINIPEDIIPNEEGLIHLNYWMGSAGASDYDAKYLCKVNVTLLGEYRPKQEVAAGTTAILGKAVLGNMILGGGN